MRKVQKASKRIPVVFATNENYAPYAGVTITSIVENSSKDFFYDIYVFYTELSKETIDKFESMSGKNYSVTCVDVNSYIDKELLYENFHFSKEMYYRILIPTILSQYEKVIYLDCDMVVVGDLSELYQTDLQGYVLAGVSDVQHYDSKRYVEDVLKLDTKKYINSGMLVINCVEFKKQKIKEQCFQILAETDIVFRYPDQDIINMACYNKIKFLPAKWNYVWHYNFPRFNKPNLLLSAEDQAEYETFNKDVKIIHYTSNVKPWTNYNIYLSKPFFDYARKTKQFKDEIFKRFKELKMKNYVVLQAIDREKDALIVTAAFYSIEDYLYNNSIYLKYGDKQHKLKFDYVRNVDLRNNCYVQKFFKFKVDLKNVKKKQISFSFFRKEFVNERLPILTGKWFPVDSDTQSKLFFNDCQLTVAGKQLLISTASNKDKNTFEKTYRKKLKKSTKPVARISAKVRWAYGIIKHFIRKDIWLISDREDVAGDNGEAFFKWLKRNKPKNVKPYFVISKSSPDYKRMKMYGKVIDPRSLKFKVLFMFAKKIISSHLSREMIEPYNVTYLKDLLFERRIIFLQHGVIKDDLSSSYSRLNQGINLFITSAKREQESIINIPEYGFSAGDVVLTGLARYDYLENDTEKTIYVIPTWRKSLYSAIQKHDMEEAKASNYYKFYESFLNNKALLNTLKKYNYKLKFVPHFLSRDIFADLKPQSNLIEVITTDISYTEMFKKGAILITDYSSVAFDFAYLKKPIIYCQFDKEEFYASHTYSQGYFDYERDAFGKVTYNANQTVEEIVKLLRNGAKMPKEYLERVKTFFAFNDQSNCSRILKVITKDDKPKTSLIKKVKKSLKVYGFKCTVKRCFSKIFRRK